MGKTYRARLGSRAGATGTRRAEQIVEAASSCGLHSSSCQRSLVRQLTKFLYRELRSPHRRGSQPKRVVHIQFWG